MGEETGACELFGEGGLACWPPRSVRWGEGTPEIAPLEEDPAPLVEGDEEQRSDRRDERRPA